MLLNDTKGIVYANFYTKFVLSKHVNSRICVHLCIMRCDYAYDGVIGLAGSTSLSYLYSLITNR